MNFIEENKKTVNNYVDFFANLHGVEIKGKDKAMPNATADGITIINFSMGSANAATIMDLLSAIEPKAVLFLGKCGGLKKKNNPDRVSFWAVRLQNSKKRGSGVPWRNSGLGTVPTL